METLTKKTYLSFGKNIRVPELIAFSEEYTKMIINLLEHLQKNEGKNTNLSFTRVEENGILHKIQSYAGLVKDVKSNSFTFLTNYHISNFSQSDDLVENQIRTDNILGIIPVLPGSEHIRIFTKGHNGLANQYFRFLVQVKNELKNLILNTNHYVKLDYGKFILEGVILEVNNSNILIQQKRMYNPEIDKNTGKYKFLDLVPQTKNVLFIERNDALKNIEIYPDSNLHINPYDED